MITILPGTEGNIIGVKAVGKLTDADYVENVPNIEAIIAREGKVRFLVDLTGFEGWDWHAAWDDFAFGIKHWGDIERMALIGDEAWETLTAKIADVLTEAEVQSFAAKELDAAWNWIKSD